MGNNEIVTNEYYLSIKEIANIVGIKEKSFFLRVWRNKNRYIYREVSSVGGRGGKKYEILVSSLEPELQEKIYTNNPSDQGGISGAPVSLETNIHCLLNEDTAGVSSFSSENNTKSYNTPKCGNDSNILPLSLVSDQSKSITGLESYPIDNIKQAPVSLVQKNVVPEDARRMALAKCDVINHWLNFRGLRTDKKQADNEFVIGYNKGFIADELLNLTGNISRSSLYRWKKILNNADNDYTALINNYNYSGTREFNSSLSAEEIQQFTLIYYNDAQLHLETAYNLLAYKYRQDGNAIHSLSTFRRYVNYVTENHKDFAVISREGTKAYNDKVGMYLHRDISDVAPGDILVADGNKLDLMVINPFTGKPCRATFVVYLDWISFDVAGYEIMISENTQCISSALRNSILRLGRIPRYVYMDNGKAFRGTYFTGCKNFHNCGFNGVYGNLGIDLIIANAYSGRSKVVERFFRNFVQQFPPLTSSYIGNCIENRPAHLKRNEDFQKELHAKDKIPTIKQVKGMIEAWLKYYRSQPCPHNKSKSIGDVFKSGIGTGVDVDMLDELMLASEIRTAKRNIIRIFGQEYSSPELHGLDKEVIVKYSLYDISKIKVYTLKNEYICEAPLVTYVPAIARNGSAIDMYTYRMQLKMQKHLRQQAMNKTKAIMSAANPFNDYDWSEPVIEAEPVKQIEKKQVKPNYEITIYENAHKNQKPKPNYEITIYENAHKLRQNKPKYEI